ncbi:MAG: TlpA family protein disulfide reductase [Bdellovibrionaceae bacterium]|nr:TlpA family protein disulfide reductase [Pseudobdellovibrionaceae bacterium]
MNAYVKGAILSLILVAGGLYWFWRYQDQLPVREKPAHYNLIDKMEREGVPTFQLPRLNGSQFDFKSVQGKVVIVNFWASWCNPCVQEFPSLIKLIDHFKGDVILLAISTDENKSDIESFLKAFGLPKPNIEILWDPERKVATTYGVGKIPESFLVGKNQKLIRKIIGIDDWATPDAFAFFTSLVQGGAPAPAPDAAPAN